MLKWEVGEKLGKKNITMIDNPKPEAAKAEMFDQKKLRKRIHHQGWLLDKDREDNKKRR